MIQTEQVLVKELHIVSRNIFFIVEWKKIKERDENNYMYFVSI